MQYTIRAIPKPLDAALRRQAKDSGKSLNEVVIETLQKGAGVQADDVVFTDLDWFVGSKVVSGTELDAALDWLDSVPRDIA